MITYILFCLFDYCISQFNNIVLIIVLTLIPGDSRFRVSSDGALELGVVVLDAVRVLERLDDLGRRRRCRRQKVL